MTYVDAYKDNNHQIHIIERGENGERILKKDKAEFVFYYEDPAGKYRSIRGEPCSKFSTTNSREYNAMVASYSAKGQVYEKGLNPVFRYLEKNYSNKPNPDLNIAFFDIETDFIPELGFAKPENPFARITAVTVYQKWTDKLITLVLKPDVPETDPNYLSYDEAERIVSKFDHGYLCDSEEQLFDLFFGIIEDSDILSGWNCLDSNSFVFLNDRIKRISDCNKDDKNILGDLIKDTNDSGLKKKYIITLDTGTQINSSIEHQFPVYVDDKFTDMSLSQMIPLVKEGIYLEQIIKKNNNQDLTWEKFDSEFDYISNETGTLEDSILKDLGKRYTYHNKSDPLVSVEMLSIFSFDQWCVFLNSIIEEAGEITKDSIIIADIENIKELHILNNWYGITSFLVNNELHIDNSDINYDFFERFHFDIKTIKYNKLRKIVSIEETNEMIEMSDISTESQYFVCNGMRVHNSTGYDIPYMVNRAKMILDQKELKRFNAFPDTVPKVKKYIKYKKEHKSYDLMGRIHLDYLDLYQKHSSSEMSSYRLDYIGFVEVGEQKVQYDGTLDDLYKKDFEKFIAYNRQDVALLNKIDLKRKYIELANNIAHTNCVLIPTTMGSVQLIDQSIVNETHRLGLVAPSKKSKFQQIMDDYEEDEVQDLDDFDINKGPAVGAHVADPKVGLHSEIGCCDINSLYPSAIRSLNMGPETIVAQVRNDRTNDMIKSRLELGMSVPEAWHNVFCLIEFDMIHNQTEDILVVDFEDGSTLSMTAKEVYDIVYIQKENNLIMSANGTIFSKERKGIIPSLLERWYSERKEMQGYEKVFSDLYNDGIQIPDELLKELGDIC